MRFPFGFGTRTITGRLLHSLTIGQFLHCGISFDLSFFAFGIVYCESPELVLLSAASSL